MQHLSNQNSDKTISEVSNQSKNQKEINREITSNKKYIVKKYIGNGYLLCPWKT